MKYRYRKFSSSNEVNTFFERLNKEIVLPVDDWYKENGLVLYGYIYDLESPLPTNSIICFGKTITPDEEASIPKVGIFATIKSYGSSKKYVGLRNIRGKIILSNQYEEILPLCEYDNDVILIVKRNGKFGLVKALSNGEEAKLILPTIYEKIFDAQEYTIGFVDQGAFGFMDLEGNIVIQPMFQDIEGNNIFCNGKAEVLGMGKLSIPYYINHYGNFVEDAYEYDNISDHNLGTGYYPYGDLPSSSDAYEGDNSNRWNTD